MATGNWRGARRDLLVLSSESPQLPSGAGRSNEERLGSPPTPDHTIRSVIPGKALPPPSPLSTVAFVPVQFTILGSGSRGNCAYLETDEVRLLIDAGFSARQIRARLAAIGRSPESLTAILITHEHTDHVQGLAGFDKLKIPIYCNQPTRVWRDSLRNTR